MIPARRRSRAAWLVGLAVLAALAVFGWQIVQRARTSGAAAPTPAAPARPLPAPDVATPKVGSLPAAPFAVDEPEPGVGDVRGVVRWADGQPLPGASVTLYRATTAWPEWQRERLAQALVGADGVFRFRAPVAHGLLVGVEHPLHAERLVAAAVDGPPLDLRLAPGFRLAGVVRTESGAPVANARVAVEAVVGDDRRVRVAVTSSAGAFEFTNLAAGPARVVARHSSWQPATLPVVAIGEQDRVEIRVARPALAPLRGVVHSVETRAPVADAVVELLPTNAQPGLADPLAARTGADGRFTIAGLPRSVMRLVVRHPRHGAVVRTVPVGVAEAPIDVELPRRSTVHGALDAARGAMPVGATLRIRDLAGQIGFASVGADGMFRFTGDWSPGPADLRLLDGAGMFARSGFASLEVRIEEDAANELGVAVSRPFGYRGRVVDELGAPIAGAVVQQAASRVTRLRTVGDAAAQLDMSNFGRSVAQLLGAEGDEAPVITDADGVFTLAGQPIGVVAIAVAAPGRATGLLKVAVAWPVDRVAPETIPLPPAARLRGQVLRAARPFAGSLVAVYRGENPVASAVTDAGGAWAIEDLAPGEYRVRARNPGQAASGEFRTVNVRAGDNAPLTLQLAPPRLVRGQVVARDGTPLAGVAVSLRRSAGASVVTGPDGVFALEAVERSDELQVVRPDRAGITFVRIPGDGGLVRVQLDTPPACELLATVAGLPGRQRLAAVLLRVAPADDDDGAARSAWFDLDDGQLLWSACPAGRMRIEVWSEGFAPFVVERELAPGKPNDLGAVLLERGARLRGRVAGPDGQPIADAQVLLGDEADFEAFEPTVRSGADGGFEVTGVGDRSSRLVVRAAGFAPAVVDLVLPRDVLSPRPLAVTLQAGAAIEAVVDRAAARAAGFVQVRRAGRFLANVEIDEAGVAVLANLPPGSYELSLLGDDRPAKTVVLAPGAVRADVQLP